jgi:hypothetical protein
MRLGGSRRPESAQAAMPGQLDRSARAAMFSTAARSASALTAFASASSPSNDEPRSLLDESPSVSKILEEALRISEDTREQQSSAPQALSNATENQGSPSSTPASPTSVGTRDQKSRK